MVQEGFVIFGIWGLIGAMWYGSHYQFTKACSKNSRWKYFLLLFLIGGPCYILIHAFFELIEMIHAFLIKSFTKDIKIVNRIKDWFLS